MWYEVKTEKTEFYCIFNVSSLCFAEKMFNDNFNFISVWYNYYDRELNWMRLNLEKTKKTLEIIK